LAHPWAGFRKHPVSDGRVVTCQELTPFPSDVPSDGLLQSLSGARYDAVEKVLYLAPNIDDDFRSFLCTTTGFGTVGVRDGKPFVDVILHDLAKESPAPTFDTS
jgi:hypothetical protein